MRVIICGAGQVGYNIASYLAKEENDVTVIDTNKALISQINNELDVNGVVGHASNPDVLNAASASGTDMMIAVTQSDEVNMVACQIAHSLFGVPKKIARIRNQAYLAPAWSNLFSRSHMPIDVIISPEVVIANEIFKRLSVPGTTYVSSLAEGRIHLLGVICEEDCPLINTPISHLGTLFPDLSFRVISIIRNNKSIIPDGTDQLLEGDEAFFVVDTAHMDRTMSAFGHEEKLARKIVIAGGGNIGFFLSNLILEKKRDIRLKVIEQNAERAEFLSESLENVIVLKGSSLDQGILEEVDVAAAETFIAVTNDDESNILSSLLAKQYGCARVITLVNNYAYAPLVSPLGLDALVSPRSTIVATIMQHVRKGRIRGLHNLREGFAEVIEAEISESSKIANASIAELNLSCEVIVAAILRGEEVIIPETDRIIRAGDLVIVLTSKDQARNVEKMFSVQVDIF